MRQRKWENLEQEAEHLARLNHAEVPSIERSYLFPDPTGMAIRMIHVDRKAFPEQEVVPIQFGPDPSESLYHAMWIAIISPNDVERLQPPAGWGSWDDAVVIERRRRAKAS